jgi:hypothetical protein
MLVAGGADETDIDICAVPQWKGDQKIGRSENSTAKDGDQKEMGNMQSHVMTTQDTISETQTSIRSITVMKLDEDASQSSISKHVLT